MSEAPPISGLVELKSLQKRVLSQIESLPSLSTVVGEFLQLSRREYFTAMDFEKILVKDQALVARLLKVANSSFFGCPRPIETVHEAIVLIGMDNMKNIVYAVSSSGLLRKQMKCYMYPDKGYWLHSMAVALSAREIADAAKSDVVGPEEAFVAGLMHDIGKLILDEFLDHEPGPRIVSLAEEKEATGFNHIELGSKIMERWNISDSIHSALRYHHDFMVEGEPHHGGAIISIADRLCNTWCVGTNRMMNLGADVEYEDHAQALDALSIKEDKFKAIQMKLRKKLVSIEDFYSGDE